MADWPADGTTNWNTVMKANIDVGHDSDGTHKKSQMLTDMEWSPTTITGANDSDGTSTFPNGLIMKWGKKTTLASNPTTVTFATAFPNACFQVIAGGGQNSQKFDGSTFDITAASFKYYSSTSIANPMRWFAIGR